MKRLKLIDFINWRRKIPEGQREVVMVHGQVHKQLKNESVRCGVSMESLTSHLLAFAIAVHKQDKIYGGGTDETL